MYSSLVSSSKVPWIAGGDTISPSSERLAPHEYPVNNKARAVAPKIIFLTILLLFNLSIALWKKFFFFGGVTVGVATGVTTGVTVGVTTGVTTGITTGVTVLGVTVGVTAGVTVGVTTGVTVLGVTTGVIVLGVTTGVIALGVTAGVTVPVG